MRPREFTVRKNGVSSHLCLVPGRLFVEGGRQEVKGGDFRGNEDRSQNKMRSWN